MIPVAVMLDDEEARCLEIALRRINRGAMASTFAGLRSAEERQAVQTALEKIALTVRLKTTRS